MSSNSKTKLSIAVLAITIGNLTGFSFQAQADTNSQSEPLERISVTGSRIKRVELEGASPVTIITAEEIKAKGFNSIYETLQSSTVATGSNQGQAIGGTARNAETINLRGLGPNRTLFLLNGKRVANYPRVYDGNYNVFNLASIPIAAVESIEIVTGASSSAYGSDAVAGVINIKTKRNIDDTTLNISSSRSGHNDAANQRFSIVTGNAKDKLSWGIATEYQKQDMLIGKQRDWLDNRYDTLADIESQDEFRTKLPTALAVYQLNPGEDWTSIDPGKGTCDQFDDLTLDNISFIGNYCGRDATGDTSLINARENASVLLTGVYDWHDEHTISVDLLYWHSQSTGVTSKEWYSDYLKNEIQAGQNWSGDGQFTIEDGTSLMLGRSFQAEEMLNGKGLEEQFNESTLNASITFNGTLFQDHDYEVYISHSLANDTQKSYQLKKETASDYFVGYEAATEALSFDIDKWWKPLDDEGFQTIFGLDKSSSNSRVTSFGASLTGNLITLFDNELAYATFVEYESSAYDLNEHPRTLNKEGQGWVGKVGTEGSGKRNRYALGAEFSIPLTQTVTASLASRYDRYLDNTLVNGALTYKFGLEWRPTEGLLLRASHGTIFRAPDLHNVFKGESISNDFVQDFPLIESCNALREGRNNDILLGGDNPELLSQTCNEQFDFTGFYNASNKSLGNKKLKEETGYSSTLGIVWEAFNETTVSFDLFNIKLKNAVVAESLYQIVSTERECLSGERDISGSQCQNVLSKIHRNGDLGFDSFKVNAIQTSYVNSAIQETTGFDMALNTLIDLGNGVELTIKSAYSHILSDKRQEVADGDIESDYRDNYYNNDFRSKVNTVIELQVNKLNASLTHVRYGSLPNDVYIGDWTQLDKKRYAPLSLYNAGMGYFFNSNSGVRLGINNLLNSKARADASEQQYPYFDARAYPQTTTIIGRQFSLSYQLTF